MVKNDTRHQDLGGGYFDKRSTTDKAKRLVGQLTRLGYEVTLQPIAKAA